MEVKFNAESLLNCDKYTNISILTPSIISEVPKKDYHNLNSLLDDIGHLSSKAQQLRTTITTANKFYSSGDNKIYIRAKGNMVIGFLKIGHKKLFIRDLYGNIHEINPICLLDFYVHESQQRSGHGKALFELMLKKEQISPSKMGYDKPSPKLVAFLKKHYNLVDYVPQNNNFIVFDDYFNEKQPRYDYDSYSSKANVQKKQANYDDYSGIDYVPESQSKKKKNFSNLGRHPTSHSNIFGLSGVGQQVLTNNNTGSYGLSNKNYDNKEKRNYYTNDYKVLDQEGYSNYHSQAVNYKGYDFSNNSYNVNQNRSLYNQIKSNGNLYGTPTPWAVNETGKSKFSYNAPTSSSSYGAHYMNKSNRNNIY